MISSIHLYPIGMWSYSSIEQLWWPSVFISVETWGCLVSYFTVVYSSIFQQNWQSVCHYTISHIIMDECSVNTGLLPDMKSWQTSPLKLSLLSYWSQSLHQPRDIKGISYFFFPYLFDLFVFVFVLVCFFLDTLKLHTVSI